MPASPFNLINSVKFLCPGSGAKGVAEVSKNGFQNGSLHPGTTPPSRAITWYRVCQRDADFIYRRARLRLRSVAETLAQSTEDKKVFPFQRCRIMRLFCHYLAHRAK